MNACKSYTMTMTPHFGHFHEKVSGFAGLHAGVEGCAATQKNPGGCLELEIPFGGLGLLNNRQPNILHPLLQVDLWKKAKQGEISHKEQFMKRTLILIMLTAESTQILEGVTL